jgi:hypothetical protein
VAPESYGSHFLSGSLYLLVAALAVGYAIALWMIQQLDRYSQEMQAPEAIPPSGLLALMARGRWFWLPPLYALALLFLLIVTFTRGASTAQFMYNKF